MFSLFSWVLCDTVACFLFLFVAWWIWSPFNIGWHCMIVCALWRTFFFWCACVLLCVLLVRIAWVLQVVLVSLCFSGAEEEAREAGWESLFSTALFRFCVDSMGFTFAFDERKLQRLLWSGSVSRCAGFRFGVWILLGFHVFLPLNFACPWSFDELVALLSGLVVCSSSCVFVRRPLCWLSCLRLIFIWSVNVPWSMVICSWWWCWSLRLTAVGFAWWWTV